MNFNNNTSKHPFQSVSKFEILAVITLLIAIFVIRLNVSFELHKLQAFDQYNLFFDADSNEYVSAIANGWGSLRTIHPGFMLLINVPIRALDYVISTFGVLNPGAIRITAPIILPAFCGFVGGVFWWLSCIEFGIMKWLRIGGLILLQASFSQMIFTLIPESYGFSGMLLCVLLWATIRAARQPEILEKWHIRIGWFVLAILLSAITITNGVLCIAVWMALRFKESLHWRQWILEGITAILILIGSIAFIISIDRLVYKQEQSDLITKTQNITSFGLNYMSKSGAERLLELPAHALASIVAPVPKKIHNELAKLNNNRYQFGFSFKQSAVTWPRIILGWLLVTIGVLFNRPQLLISPIARTCTITLLFNVVLHTVWGSEMFLYSQHWLAFLVFVVIMGLNSMHQLIGPFVIGLSSLIALNNILILKEIIEILEISY